MEMKPKEDYQIQGPLAERFAEILTPAAASFAARLHRNFNPTREALLALRTERQAKLDAGALLDFLPETRAIRERDWKVAPVPEDLQDRRVEITSDDLLEIRVPGGEITEAGLRNNVAVALQYIESWLLGTGAAAIYNLMEDAATAEISRSQVWQWVRHGAVLREGHRVSRELVATIADEELGKIRQSIGEEAYARSRFAEARDIFEQVALGEEYIEFLTILAYEHI